MFAISIADILGSVAMGLTTLPMPKDTGTDHDDFGGTALGNTQTCEAQGFFFVFGTTAMFGYNAMLCVYYTCAIAFTMKEQQIVRWVEPWLHIMPLVVALIYAVIPLVKKFYQASSYEAWCTVVPVIHDQHQQLHADAVIVPLILTNIGLMLTIVITSLGLIIRRIHRMEKLLASVTITFSGRRINRTSQLISDMKMVERSHNNTKVVIIQASAYIGVFLLTLLFPLLRSATSSIGERNDSFKVLIGRLSIVFMPLQGFFNALIFISHKIYNYRRVHEDVSRWEILWMLLRGSLDEPMLFSRISQIDIRAGQESIDVELADEKNIIQVALDMNSFDDDAEQQSNDDDDDCLEQFSDNQTHNGSQNLSGFVSSQNQNQSSTAGDTFGDNGVERFSDANNQHEYGSQNLSGFTSSQNDNQSSVASNAWTSFHRSIFSHGSTVSNQNDGRNNNAISSTPGNFKASSTNVSRAGLSGFSSSLQNDSNVSYDSRN